MQFCCRCILPRTAWHQCTAKLCFAGNRQGRPDFFVLNLGQLEGRFQPGEEVTLEKLKERGFARPSGWRRRLPLKVLGDGELKSGLTIKAGAFSKQAQSKIEAAGGKAETLEGRRKWTRAAFSKHVADLKAAGKDYYAEKRKARVAALARKVLWQLAFKGPLGQCTTQQSTSWDSSLVVSGLHPFIIMLPTLEPYDSNGIGTWWSERLGTPPAQGGINCLRHTSPACKFNKAMQHPRLSLRAT